MKPRELFKLFSLPRAPTRRIYHFEMKGCLNCSKLDQNRKMEHKQKKCAVCSEKENTQQVTFIAFFFFFILLWSENHRWSFRVRVLHVVQVLVISGRNLWLQKRVYAKARRVIESGRLQMAECDTLKHRFSQLLT